MKTLRMGRSFFLNLLLLFILFFTVSMKLSLWVSTRMPKEKFEYRFHSETMLAFFFAFFFLNVSLLIQSAIMAFYEKIKKKRQTSPD